MYLGSIIDFFSNIFNGSVRMVGWLFTPIEITGIGSFQPIMMLTFSFLVLYLGVAIVKWLL